MNAQKSQVFFKRFLIGFAEYFKSRYYLLTALLHFLSFPSFDVAVLKVFPFFAWFAFVPLFYYIKDKGTKKVFITSFVTYFWASVFTYHWIGNFGIKVFGGYVIIVAFISLALAIFFATAMAIGTYFTNHFPRLRIVIIPAAVLLINWVQSIGFLAFPWPFIGYSQYPFKSFIQIASVVGIFGISFAVLFFNCLLADLLLSLKTAGRGLHSLLRGREGRRVLIFLLVFVLVNIGGLVRLNSGPESTDSMRVSIIQSCINPWDSYNNTQMELDDLDILLKLTDQSLGAHPDFIIWSESATLRYLSTRYKYNNFLEFERRLFSYIIKNQRPLLTGEIGLQIEMANGHKRHQAQNNAVLISGEGHVEDTYSKIHLVPFGEWFPYRDLFPSFIGNMIDSFGASHFKPGRDPVVFEINGKRFGVLVCYEGIFHRLCREYKKRGVDFFVNITNDGWTDTYNGHMQHYAASVFRAIENGVWYARAGNTGYTAIIDPFGAEVASIPILGKGYLVGDMNFKLNRDTIYTVICDVVLYIVWGLFSVLFVLVVVKRFTRK